MASVTQVSVVMGVFDGGEEVDTAIASVVAQLEGSDELIIVNDGSGPGTTGRLRAWAKREPRIHLEEQENHGLTAALIRGCDLARAPVIVRQDADDVSLPGRLQALKRVFAQDPAPVLASSWVECVGPGGEVLYVTTRPLDPDRNRHALLYERLGPPCHGAVAFSRPTYLAVGGYRAAFRYGQDADLWLRLAERGGVACVPQVLYRFTHNLRGISSTRRFHQRLFGELGQACAAARRAGRDDVPLLAQAAEILSRPAPSERHADADALYFVGSCLLRRGDPRSAGYLWRSYVKTPWRLRSLAKSLAATALRLVRRRAPDGAPPAPPPESSPAQP